MSLTIGLISPIIGKTEAAGTIQPREEKAQERLVCVNT